MQTGTVAVIGSFRSHLADVLSARETFRAVGIDVTTPLGSTVLEQDAEFVRFESDPPGSGDAAVQSMALHRILRAEAVFVVAPEGYVGRTTCYEVGRCMQAARPLYFSHPPLDLPIDVPPSHVVTAGELAAYILEGVTAPMLPLHDEELANYERRLVSGDYDIC
ncbi:hypothetical protein [Microbacterium phyllosphaerae]